MIISLSSDSFGFSSQIHTNSIQIDEESFMSLTIIESYQRVYSVLPYSDIRKQLLKITFLVNEQNVSVMYIDIRGYYLETDPDPVAMVIRVELFIHKPCTQMTPLT